MSVYKGLSNRRTPSGVKVIRVHYTADPERDSAWAKQERRKYSSQAAWDREQEIIHEAGGGELLFAEILNRYADKIIIRDPKFKVPPNWKRIAGFDHGKTNPTAALVTAIDYDGTIIGLDISRESDSQIQFINLVIDCLTQSGWMHAAQLYDSPFTEYSPRGIEGVFNPEQVAELVGVLDEIRARAGGQNITVVN